MNLIDKDKLLRAAENAFFETWHDYDIALSIIESAEIVDVNKCGKWVSEKCNHKPYRIKNPEKWVIYKCSICGYGNGRKQSNYCPDCGAKMNEGSNVQVGKKEGD